MKIYVINLDKDKVRLETIDARLRAFGLSYERIPAVDGRLLTTEEKRKSVNAFRNWSALGRKMRDGEIGCGLSHLRAYRKIVEAGDALACVLEDDVILDDRFPDVLHRIEQVPARTNAQVFLLNNHTGGELRAGVDGFVLISARTALYMEGYVISLKAARNLLRANWPLQTPSDGFGRFVERGAIKLCYAAPTVCSQQQTRYVSNTAGKGVRVSNLSRVRWCLYKLNRVVGLSLDHVICRLERLLRNWDR